MKLTIVLLLLCAFVATAYGACRDKSRYCRQYKKKCKRSRWIRRRCPKTCGTCGPKTQAPPTQGPPQPPTQGPPQPPTQGPPQPPTQGPPPPTQGPPGSCGVPQVQLSRVIAGDNAKRGAWPWQILMLKNGRPGCGGSLINSRWVVTAAHCVDRSENRPSSFKVRVGEHDRNSREGSEVDMEVERVVMHERYGRLDYDIALFKLKKPVQFNQYVQPVCLPSADVAPGTECYITGWGKIRHPGNMHHYLQQAMMPVVSNKVCHAKNNKAIPIPISARMICAGDAGATRKSGCHGDSGGPFVCKVGGRWELHGDVSHGSSRCSSSETYTVFARTSFFVKWINDKMAKYGM